MLGVQVIRQSQPDNAATSPDLIGVGTALIQSGRHQESLPSRCTCFFTVEDVTFVSELMGSSCILLDTTLPIERLPNNDIYCLYTSFDHGLKG